jgi:hypothetical protein
VSRCCWSRLNNERREENQLELLFDGSTFISFDGTFDGLLCFLPLNVTDNIKTYFFKWWVEKILIFHTKLKIESYFFQNQCGEVRTSYNIQAELRTFRFIMLCRNSNVVLQSMFFTTLLYINTCNKESNVFNYNEARKWLLMTFWSENHLSQIAIVGGMTCNVFPKVSWDVANWYSTRWCPHKIGMPHTMICFRIQASNLLQTQATRLYWHAFNRGQSNFYDQSLQPLLWYI